MEKTPWNAGNGQIEAGDVAEGTAALDRMLDQVVSVLASQQGKGTSSWNFEECVMKELFSEVWARLREPVRDVEVPNNYQQWEGLYRQAWSGKGRQCCSRIPVELWKKSLQQWKEATQEELVATEGAATGKVVHQGRETAG